MIIRAYVLAMLVANRHVREIRSVRAPWHPPRLDVCLKTQRPRTVSNTQPREVLSIRGSRVLIIGHWLGEEFQLAERTIKLLKVGAAQPLAAEVGLARRAPAPRPRAVGALGLG
jgi:hypothetical protein